MNEIEKIKEDVDSIVAFLVSNTHIIGKNSDIIKQLAERQIKPTEPDNKGYQGLGKWYVTKNNSISFAHKQENFNIECYGICKNYWQKTILTKVYFERLATPEEITQAILKGCEQKGIVEGVRVRCLHSGTLKLISSLTGLLNKNQLWMDADSVRVLVFDNGNFAEVVKEEKPTDRELLMECLVAFEGYVNDGVLFYQKSKELITKLTNHLNHEHTS